jgi:tRNA (adenine37-N6)-methyltransferase
MTLMLTFNPIGILHTPHKTLEGMPIQPAGAKGLEGTAAVFPEFRDGLDDLEGFSHIILIYHFHECCGYGLRVTPFLDSEPRGLFATRAPKRPNPIGLSVVELVSISGGILRLRNVDMLDGTPLLDIKPFVPAFDSPAQVRAGWLEKAGGRVAEQRSDDRFQ